MQLRLAITTSLLALSAAGLVACDDEDEDPNGPPDTETFEANLSGAAEKPTPVTTTATGEATFTVTTVGTTTTVVYSVTVNGNLSGPVTQAHIHGPADANNVAPPIVTLQVTSQNTTGVVVSGSFSVTGHGAINIAQLIQHMVAGNTYVNLHTAANPNGEIRGQISD